MAVTIHRPARWAPAVTVEPTLEPVGLEEMKAHGVYEAADDDALVAGFIVAARKRVEAMTQRAIMTQTRTYKMSCFPARDDALIELPGGKVQSVSSIAYTDTNGDPQTWTSSDYVVDMGWEPCRIGLAYDASWPSVREWDLPITITYVCGYGDYPGNVPEDLRAAIRIIAASMYEQREAFVMGPDMAPAYLTPEKLISPYRVRHFV